MALGTTVISPTSGPAVPRTAPVSLNADWAVVLETITPADNSGSTVVTVSSLAASTCHKLQVSGTRVQFCVRYPTGSTLSTDPVIDVFGLDANGVPQKLLEATGSTHEFTLSDDATNDVRDATYKYTAVKEVDAQGNKEVIFGIKTAAVCSAGTAQLLAKCI